MNGQVIMKLTLSASIELLPYAKFCEIINVINSIPEYDTEAQQAARATLERIKTAREDVQGRFVIDRDLAKKAGINKNIIFTSSGERVEIWAAENYGENFGAALTNKEYKELYLNTMTPYLKVAKKVEAPAQQPVQQPVVSQTYYYPQAPLQYYGYNPYMQQPYPPQPYPQQPYMQQPYAPQIPLQGQPIFGAAPVPSQEENNAQAPKQDGDGVQTPQQLQMQQLQSQPYYGVQPFAPQGQQQPYYGVQPFAPQGQPQPYYGAQQFVPQGQQQQGQPQPYYGAQQYAPQGQPQQYMPQGQIIMPYTTLFAPEPQQTQQGTPSVTPLVAQPFPIYGAAAAYAAVTERPFPIFPAHNDGGNGDK
jgi:DNA-binding transcriptional regulator/RsmH inhibitor MraZ